MAIFKSFPLLCFGQQDFDDTVDDLNYLNYEDYDESADYIDYLDIVKLNKARKDELEAMSKNTTILSDISQEKFVIFSIFLASECETEIQFADVFVNDKALTRLKPGERHNVILDEGQYFIEAVSNLGHTWGKIERNILVDGESEKLNCLSLVDIKEAEKWDSYYATFENLFPSHGVSHIHLKYDTSGTWFIEYKSNKDYLVSTGKGEASMAGFFQSKCTDYYMQYQIEALGSKNVKVTLKDTYAIAAVDEADLDSASKQAISSDVFTKEIALAKGEASTGVSWDCEGIEY